MYYTPDHEWIDFQGIIAYVGLSNFKLLGFKTIHEISSREPLQTAAKGEVLARVRYNDWNIGLHMPVDGRILRLNSLFIVNNLAQIAEHMNRSGWMISIAPTNPDDRHGLIPFQQYRQSMAKLQKVNLI